MSEYLVTGGAGFIGSHITEALVQRGQRVRVLDNSSTGRLDALQGCLSQIAWIEGDVRDLALLERVFAEHQIDAVIHFAALKAVGESVARPLAYYDANVGGTVALLRAMQQANVTRFVFSSSATVYGAPDSLPIREEAPIRTTDGSSEST